MSRQSSYYVVQEIYEGTVVFCGRFMDKRSADCKGMISAAHSAMQNIDSVEPSACSTQEAGRFLDKTRIRLEELMRYYEDFLRQRKLRAWGKDEPAAVAAKVMYKAGLAGQRKTGEARQDPYCIESMTAGNASNILLYLVNRAYSLLGKQKQKMEKIACAVPTKSRHILPAEIRAEPSTELRTGESESAEVERPGFRGRRC
jgi:restriction system protein